MLQTDTFFPPIRSILTLALLLCCGVSVFFVILRTPSTLRVDIGAPGDARYIANFYRIEYSGDTDFRWSKPDSQLILHGASSGPSVLSMRTHNNDLAQTGNKYVVLKHGTHTLSSFWVAPGWRVYSVLLPPNAVTDTGFTTVPLDVTLRTYHSIPNDFRELGIPLDTLHLRSLRGVAAPWDVPLQRALHLGWVLVVLAWLLGLLNHALGPRRGIAIAMRRVALQSMLVAGVLAAWAWYNPFVLAWACSASHGLLVGITVGLGIGTLLTIVFPIRPFANRFSPQSTQSTQRKYTAWNMGMGEILQRSHARLGERGIKFNHSIKSVLVLVLAHGMLLAPLPVVWHGIAAWVVVGMPGVLLMHRLCDCNDAPLERVFLALCGALALSPLVLLPIQALPGEVPRWLLWLACDALSVALLLFPPKQDIPYSGEHREHTESRFESSPAVYHGQPVGYRSSFASGQARSLSYVIVLLLGACVRVAFLGSAEFQGDEVQVIHMATGVMQGWEDILLKHRKGPMEILLVALPMVMTGYINEWVARLPFACAGVGSLLGVYLIARRMFHNNMLGMLAVAILSFDGFMIAFSRIVQYQNVVLLMTIGGIWCVWRFAEGGSKRYLALAALFASVGMLAHYDSVFGLPAMGWLVFIGGMQRGWYSVQQWVRNLALPVLVGVVVVASFYLPFVFHDYFARTVEYLIQSRIGERTDTGFGLNNLIDYYRLSTFYNTMFQIHTLAVALALCFVVWLWVYACPRVVGRIVAMLLLVGCGIMVWNAAWFALPDGSNWAIVAFALPIAGLVLLPTTPLPLRTLVLWFGFPFVAESFLIADPNTHFYTMHPAAGMLVAFFVVQVVQWVRQREMMWLLSPLLLWGCALLMLTIPYTYIVFLRQSPEYERRFPETRPLVYLAHYGDHRPNGGYFGFPHRDGWKAVSELYRQGILQGSYISNQKPLITTWYVRGVERREDAHDATYYFSVIPKGYRFIPETFHVFGYIEVDGIRMMDLYKQEPRRGPLQVYRLSEYVDSFDARPIPPMPVHEELFEIAPPE